jgi:hypothetical protein
LADKFFDTHLTGKKFSWLTMILKHEVFKTTFFWIGEKTGASKEPPYRAENWPTDGSTAVLPNTSKRFRPDQPENVRLPLISVANLDDCWPNPDRDRTFENVRFRIRPKKSGSDRTRIRNIATDGVDTELGQLDVV